LQGAEGNGLINLVNNQGMRLDGLVGFRYLNLLESLTFTSQTSSSVVVPGLSPLLFNTLDSYRVSNNFYGGQLGGPITSNLGGLGSGLYFTASGKVALGSMNEIVAVDGRTATNILTGAAAQVYSGGAFAQPPSIGHYNRDRFAVIPEGNFNLGYQVCRYA